MTISLGQFPTLHLLLSQYVAELKQPVLIFYRYSVRSDLVNTCKGSMLSRTPRIVDCMETQIAKQNRTKQNKTWKKVLARYFSIIVKKMTMYYKVCRSSLDISAVLKYILFLSTTRGCLSKVEYLLI